MEERRAGEGRNKELLVWGCPKIRITFLGVPVTRIIVIWDLYWGPPVLPVLGNYHVSNRDNGFSSKRARAATTRKGNKAANWKAHRTC